MGHSITAKRLALKPGLTKGASMNIRIASIALLLGSLSATPLAGHPSHSTKADESPRTIVVVVAHPDDELFFAPALHGLAEAGHTVNLVFATNGDQGPGVSDMQPGAALASARIAEAHCSAKALGADTLYRLGLGDGTLANQARKEGSAANRLRAELGEYIEGAATVITWGPEGGYGHSDHRMVSSVVTQLVQAMPAGERPTLLYPALIHAPLPDVLAQQGWTLTAPDLADVNYTYNDADLAAATAATQCHKTQFDDATRAALVPGFDAAVWKGVVSFRRAF